MSGRREDKRGVTPATRAYMGLSEVEDLAERPVSRLRKVMVVLMAFGAVTAPVVWAGSAFAHDDQPAATLAKGPGSGSEDDDEGSSGSGDDDDDVDTGGTDNGGATDRGGDTSANGEDTAGTTAGTGRVDHQRRRRRRHQQGRRHRPRWRHQRER